VRALGLGRLDGSGWIFGATFGVPTPFCSVGRIAFGASSASNENQSLAAIDSFVV